MIEIKKGREPRRLETYRQKPGANYADLNNGEDNKDLKNEILESLLNEQGHLCAYCMRRIPERRKLPYGIPKVSIEHWYPQNPDTKNDIGQGLDYRNMFAVCAGNRGCGDQRYLTCDAKRGNKQLIVNPCSVDTLKSIGYYADGTIYSSDNDINDDLNVKLNLNCKSISLPQTRLEVLNELLRDIKKNHSTGDIKLYCRRRLDELKQPNKFKTPYVGILIFWLEKHT